MEQAPSLRLALGRLSLERKSHKGVGQDDDDADMQQVEMLLEAYFIQMDNTFNRLETMNEYISDTEVCLVSAAVTRHLLFVCLCVHAARLSGAAHVFTRNKLLCVHRSTLILRSTTSGTI